MERKKYVHAVVEIFCCTDIVATSGPFTEGEVGGLYKSVWGA